MTDIGFYHDFRATRHDAAAPLKFYFSHKGRTAYIKTDIKLTAMQWDMAGERVVNHEFSTQYNLMLTQMRAMLEKEVADLRASLELAHMSAKEVKDRLVYVIMGARYEEKKKKEEEEKKNTTFAKVMLQKANKSRKDSTREVYISAYRRLQKFDPDFEKKGFESIDKKYIESVEQWMTREGHAKNTIVIQLKSMRATFNEAIDEEITALYPFRRYRIRGEATPKRALAIEQLHAVMTGHTTEKDEMWLDVFRLIFYLIGINIIDLCHLTPKNVRRGRIEYHRAKTGRLYSIKLEPEAMHLIRKYKGKGYLLNFLDNMTFKNFMHCLNEHLKKMRIFIGDDEVEIEEEITSYWARHSWATTAAELDIPKETISAALGHNIGSEITSTYINFDEKKIDNANRRVMDYVFNYKGVNEQGTPASE